MGNLPLGSLAPLVPQPYFLRVLSQPHFGLLWQLVLALLPFWQ